MSRVVTFFFVRRAVRARVLAAATPFLMASVLTGTSACTRASEPAAAFHLEPGASYSYRPAEESRTLVYPRDHGAHRDAAYEWWYFTGHLAPSAVPAPANPALTSSSELAGFELTVFRISPPAGPRPADPEAQRPDQSGYLIAHLAYSDVEHHRFTHQSFAVRERAGVAVVSNQGLQISMPGIDLDFDSAKSQLTFNAHSAAMDLQATLHPKKPLVLHGHQGYSRKGPCPSCASHYVSYTRLEGPMQTKTAAGAQSGEATVWFDHEFGSNSLAPDQSGWDWFALQLSDGWDLMLFRLRDRAGQLSFVDGTWIDPRGNSSPVDAASVKFVPGRMWQSTVTGATYPVAWRLELRKPGQASPFQCALEPQLDNQEVVGGEVGLATYWEGTMRILEAGAQSSAPRSLGRAYLEMTGYDAAHRPSF